MREWKVGDRVTVEAIGRSGEVARVEGESSDRRYFIDYDLTARSRDWGTPIVFEDPDEGGWHSPDELQP